MGYPLAIVVKGFPRLSETFIARELEALERRGLRFSLHALRNPGKDAALTRYSVQAECSYLPEYLHDAPFTVLKAFVSALSLPGFRDAWRQFMLDLGQDFTRARFRRFGQACVLATRLGAETRHIYCHFSHSPASVTRYAARLLKVGYSISAHAKDAWTDPEWDLRLKLDGATFVTTCNRSAFDRLKLIAPHCRLHLNHHGIEASLIVKQATCSSRAGNDPGNPVRILSVARAVEKKGLVHLLQALKQLPPDLHFRIEHFGDGPLLPSLKALARDSGLGEKVTFHGGKAHEDVIAAMDASDVLVFPADVASDGDRDGIPNVILEANARGLCVVACNAGGVSEAVLDGVTGALVPRADPDALAERLDEVIRNPDLRRRWAENALNTNMSAFDGGAGHDSLFKLLSEEVKAQ